ncbi:MAG: ribosome small subunit-dependent GTPase A [Ktedonobacterales bacterium]
MNTRDSAASISSENADATLVEGLIVDGSRGIYRVQTPTGDLLCTIRGRLRKELSYAESANARKSVRKVAVKAHDPVAVGDHVRALPTGGDSGVIEEIVARTGGAFSRRDPDPKGGAKGTLTTVAGLDQLVAVFATREPEPHLGMLDRLLVVAEAQGIAALICFTKVDQGMDAWLTERLRVYERLGYPILLTSVTTGEGVAALRERLAGKVSAFVGKSGVGKSSLLNALTPGLGQRVSEVSATTGKGRHTTTSTRLFPLDGPAGGYIADTAGIRALGLDGDATSDLDQHFREFRPYIGHCAHRDCRHGGEPGCAIRAAILSGAIDRERYESYLRLREGE